MNIIYRKHLFLLIGAVGVLTAGIVMIVQFFSALDQKKQEVLAVRDRLASYEVNKKIYQNESEEFALITQEVAVLEAYRVTPETTPTLLSTIEVLAQKYSVGFTITSVQTPMSGQEPKLVIDFNGKGDFKNITAFLEALLNQSFEVKFTNLSLNKTAQPRGESSDGMAETTVNTWQALATIEIVSY